MKNNDSIKKLPIDGILDLHAFHPRDVKDLVPEYLIECRRLGIEHVRIIHGKGTGTLRRIVQGILERHPHVISFKTADLGGGSWGATEVLLRINK
ncbi:MAG: Smr/MutS family protein [Candidatus Aminicenantes bacterium]|nr:Smr/MutS family protein [Candidatus Aminicenantes bacterium]